MTFMIPGMTSPLTWQTKLLLLGALFLAGVACGVKLTNALHDQGEVSDLKAAQERLEAVREFNGFLQSITDQSSKRLANSVVPRGTITIEKEVIKYVKDNDHPACVLDPDWVRIYNRSLLPKVPGT
jgi:hypothetical protein